MKQRDVPAECAWTPFEDLDGVLATLGCGFKEKKALVVGDLMLDHYVWGEVDRISPEAPVPVVRVERETYSGGGAANVALNLSVLGLQAAVAGVVGADTEQEILMSLLDDGGVKREGVISTKGRATIRKTRVIAARQQMLRVDRETSSPISANIHERIMAAVVAHLRDGVSIIVLSDYAKGVLSARTCHEIIDHACGYDTPVFVDPKGLNYDKYAGATAIAPNRTELAAACHVPSDDLLRLLDAGEQLRERLELGFLVGTLGEDGMVLIDEQHRQRVPALVREVFDVSGAGDAAIATLAAAYVGGLSRLDCVRLANVAGGIAVGRVGAVSIRTEELREAISGEAPRAWAKLYSLDALAAQVTEWRLRGQRVVFTNGCFDLLHAGHVVYLERARALGDRLVVALNTDRSVRALKGKSRPIVNEQDRASILCGLAAVDALVFFDEETPIRVIEALRPEVLTKGQDYREERVVGAPEVKSWGGEVVLIPLVDGQSSTGIIRAIEKAHAGSEGGQDRPNPPS